MSKCLIILLIEDNSGDVQIVEEYLTHTGMAPFTLAKADRFSAGLKRIAQGDIDVVLLDLGLPDSQGLESLATIRKQAPNVPVVILTGLDTEETGIAALQNGAQDYLVKGRFSSSLLIRAIRYAVERQRLEEALRHSKDGLALRVEERTAELLQANDALRGEVAERRRVEETLRTSEALLCQFVEQTPVAVAMFDTQMRYLVCSQRWLKDYHLGTRDITGLSHYEVFPEIPERLKQIHRHCLAGAVERCDEDPFPRQDGSIDWIRWQIHPWRNNSGAVGGIILYTEVITEKKNAEEQRRRLEAQIQHAQKLECLGVLAGGIAHDFNNLLTVILGNTSLALMQMAPESAAVQTVEEVEKASLRAAELIKQMLAYSGKGHFLIQELNLSRVVEEMAHLLQTVISKKAVLRFDFAANLPTIHADATQVRQVIMNLITNASDAIGEKSGVIILRTGLLHANRDYLTSTYVHEELPEGYYVYLEVSDTGCGMDQQTMEKIFDPFFTTKFTGRGLGLAAVLGIMRGHHAAIKIYSEPNRGTTFKVLFPCSAYGESVRDVVSVHETWRGTGTILVVDDEESVRTVIKKALEGIGFQVLLACHGLEGLEVYRQHSAKITAVLLDLTMPHMNGPETFRELRLLRPDIRVILMSGYSEDEVTNLFAGKGLAGFVQKPFRVDDLLGVLRRALGN